MAEHLLELENVSKTYELRRDGFGKGQGGTVHAVDGVSLHIDAGQVLGLVGESGCGKSTVGRLACWLEKPTSGRILLDGSDVARASKADRHRVTLMFQDTGASLDPRMQVGDIIAEPLAIARVSRSERRARTLALMSDVGLESTLTDRFPHELSGGQRQRVGLARALALDPELLIADEPVSALDVSVQAQVLNLLRGLRTRRTLGVLFISHDLAVVRYLADRVGVMYLGHLVECGPAAAVFDSPAHPYTSALRATVDPRRSHRSSPILTGEIPSAVSPPSGCAFRTRCPLATELCASTAPPLVEVGPDHTSACHYPERAADAFGLSEAVH